MARRCPAPRTAGRRRQPSSRILAAEVLPIQKYVHVQHNKCMHAYTYALHTHIRSTPPGPIIEVDCPIASKVPTLTRTAMERSRGDVFEDAWVGVSTPLLWRNWPLKIDPRGVPSYVTYDTHIWYIPHIQGPFHAWQVLILSGLAEHCSTPYSGRTSAAKLTLDIDTKQYLPEFVRSIDREQPETCKDVYRTVYRRTMHQVYRVRHNKSTPFVCTDRQPTAGSRQQAAGRYTAGGVCRAGCHRLRVTAERRAQPRILSHTLVCLQQ